MGSIPNTPKVAKNLRLYKSWAQGKTRHCYSAKGA